MDYEINMRKTDGCESGQTDRHIQIKKENQQADKQVDTSRLTDKWTNRQKTSTRIFTGRKVRLQLGSGEKSLKVRAVSHDHHMT